MDVFWIAGAHLQIVAVPWRKSEDGAKMGSDGVKGDVVMMEMEKHDLAPKSAHITREDLEVFGFTAKCPWLVSLLTGTATQAYTGNCRRRIEEELRGNVKAEAAQRCVKEYQDTAVERRTKRSPARRKVRRTHHQQRVRSNAAPASSSRSSGDAARTGTFEEGNGSSWVDKRKADGEAEDGRRGGRVQVEDNCELEDVVRTEAKKECEVTLEVVELAEMEVDEEEVEWRTEGEAQFQEEGGDLDPEQVRQRREEEMNYMVKTKRRQGSDHHDMDRSSEERRRS